MKIAVTGAFSYSGKYITKRLLERGEEVITLTGHPNRPDPFGGKVKVYPLDFDEASMTRSLQGVEVLVNTYWVRFDKGENTQPRAVENTRKLINAAKAAGVKRIVHISIANPSADSHLPYYWGKAANEKTVMESGLSYAILRPTVLIGKEDILINNIAFLLRRFPFFLIPGDGSYCIQPVYIEDLADLAVEGVYSRDNYVIDAVGPELVHVQGIGAIDRRKNRCKATNPVCPTTIGVAGRAIPEPIHRRCHPDAGRGGWTDGQSTHLQTTCSRQDSF